MCTCMYTYNAYTLTIDIFLIVQGTTCFILLLQHPPAVAAHVAPQVSPRLPQISRYMQLCVTRERRPHRCIYCVCHYFSWQVIFQFVTIYQAKINSATNVKTQNESSAKKITVCTCTYNVHMVYIPVVSSGRIRGRVWGDPLPFHWGSLASGI